MAELTGHRLYWRLLYNAETGPDSWQGGYDTPKEAQEALAFQRATDMQRGESAHPERWTATRTTKITIEEDEGW